MKKILIIISGLGLIVLIIGVYFLFFQRSAEQNKEANIDFKFMAILFLKARLSIIMNPFLLNILATLKTLILLCK